MNTSFSFPGRGARTCILLVACLWLSPQARAYVDLAPTLAKIISDSQRVEVVEVVQFDHEKHTLTLRPVRALKGSLDPAPLQHDVAASGGSLVPRTIQQWAEPGARGVAFLSRATVLVCVGEGWYAVRSTSSGGWKLSTDRADLPLAYYGKVSRLVDGIALMMAGKDAVLTTVQHGVDDAASFDLALNRASLPGLLRLQRIRGNLGMPERVMAVSANPAFLIGRGEVGEEDLPTLLTQLADKDSTVRAEAAEDLGQLGRKAAAAQKALTTLLGDKAPRARLSAASALLCINSTNQAAADVLAKGLADPDSTVRRDAAQAVGRCGTGATPLIEKVATLLNDPTEATRVSALQAIALLGPIASNAVPAVVPLLDDTNLCVDAADALGRIGPRARPVPKRLVEMLSSKEAAIQWAAVRAMAQIGGKEAHPAVEFIAARLPNATEINAYNMMIYLALLGPDAIDAMAAARNAPLGHPVIPSATVWAMAPDRYPWQAGGGMFGGRGGRGGGGRGGGGGGGGGFDLSTTMYEAYVRELGERLRPLALRLAQDILKGNTGDMPLWGYKLLNCAPDECVSTLSGCLAESDAVLRERVAVALGYMGPTAYAAKDEVSRAIGKTQNEQERRLLEWCLREISL